MRTTLQRLAFITLPLGLTALIAACDSEVDDAMEEAASEQALDSVAGATPQAMEPVGGTGNRIAVTLTEWSIHMPETLAPGSYTFEVTNAGGVEHVFEIEGASDEWETDPLAPGATATLTAELSAGTYTVYCPVSGDAGEHAELGMRRTLLVR